MEPVPTSFHLGPLVFHTYGLGLAITAYVAFRYGEARFKRRGLDPASFASFTAAVLVAALIGARAAHVAANWGYYAASPARILFVWQGGLASFGGIALAAPTGYVLARRWWRDTRFLAFTDALIPVLVGAWALGRLLGPQLMVAGGGHVTHQWFGLRYAGQVGRRVPVPLIQALEDGTLFGVLLLLERRVKGASRAGVITGVGCVVWGVVRATDEHFLLGGGANGGSIGVEISGLVLAILGALALARAVQNPRSSMTD